ncbi:MAG: hypothetical protein IJY91_01690 [Oscillospiraceae bacterium]|nr:hypothetical protein [Oscillospiraceae bacterium]
MPGNGGKTTDGILRPKTVAVCFFLWYNQSTAFKEVFSMLVHNMQETAGGDPAK